MRVINSIKMVSEEVEQCASLNNGTGPLFTKRIWSSLSAYLLDTAWLWVVTTNLVVFVGAYIYFHMDHLLL